MLRSADEALGSSCLAAVRPLGVAQAESTWRTISRSRGVSVSRCGSRSWAIRYACSVGGIQAGSSATARIASRRVSIAKRLILMRRPPAPAGGPGRARRPPPRSPRSNGMATAHPVSETSSDRADAARTGRPHARHASRYRLSTRRDRVAVRHRERAAGEEVPLHVDHEQRIAPTEPDCVVGGRPSLAFLGACRERWPALRWAPLRSPM